MNIFKQITANNIQLEVYPYLRELAMEAYLMENESILKLDDDNFSDPSVIDAEIALEGARNNRNGRIDIFAKYASDTYAIAELKLDEINEDTLLQLESYLKKRNQLIDYIRQDTDDDPSLDLKNLKWVGILIGRYISRELSDKLIAGYELDLDGVKIPIAGITINRYRNKITSEIYVVSDTYFKFSTSNRDYTKFEYNNQQYNKGQLVNAVLKDYAADNPTITYSELEKLFPKSIQGGKVGVFTTSDIAQEIYDRTGHKRHKIQAEELIKLSDSTIATSTQWNSYNIQSFINAAKELGISIT